jgi:hypothetical protein
MFHAHKDQAKPQFSVFEDSELNGTEHPINQFLQIQPYILMRSKYT